MNSEDSKKNQIDSRTFPEIWKTLTSYEQSELRHNLIVARCCKTGATVWNWAVGNTRPLEPLVLEGAAKVISAFLTKLTGTSVKCPYQTLFPRA